MNKIYIIGRLTADPTVRDANGTSVCSFSVASNTRRKDEDGNPVPIFYRVDVWRGLGDNCAKYLHKGDRVSVVGNLSMREYTDTKGQTRVSLDVTADDIEFLTERNTAPAGSSNAKPSQAVKKTSATTATRYQAPVDDDEEDLPF